MRVYVGTYAKYNAGSLEGAWLDLADYTDKDEFLEDCRELHKDEDDPEFMFQDTEEVPGGLVTESSVSPECWEVLKAYDEYDEGAVNAYLYLFSEWNEADFQDRYRGEFDSWEKMAEELMDDTGELKEIPSVCAVISIMKPTPRISALAAIWSSMMAISFGITERKGQPCAICYGVRSASSCLQIIPA